MQCKEDLLNPIHSSDFNLPEFQQLNLPPNETLHILSQSKTHKGKVLGVSTHVWTGPLPKQALLRYSKDLALCSPELMLATFAQRMPLSQLLCLALELCGQYRLEHQSIGSGHPLPLTNTSKLTLFAERMRGIYGYRKFEQLTNYVAENSWSPMETRLYIFLTLPRTLGGFGIPKPHLNYEIGIPEELRPADGRSHCFIDMYWPEYKLAIEYDGDTDPVQGHFSVQGSIRDKQKLACLTSLGIQCISLTSYDMNTWMGMEKTAKRLMTSMKLRKRPVSEHMLENRIKLRNEMFSSSWRTGNPH